MFSLYHRVPTGAETFLERFEDEEDARRGAIKRASTLPEGHEIRLIRTAHGTELKLIGVYARPPRPPTDP